MKFYEHPLYKEDISYVSSFDLPWEKLSNRSVMISGATGLIGSFLIDVLIEKNKKGLNCTVFALSRNKEKAKDRFSYCFDSPLFKYVSYDVTEPLQDEAFASIDYIIHMASNTHPMQYSLDPIGTISTNIIGLYNMLEFATKHDTVRFAFCSSNEIYGENRGDVEKFKEEYCGYIDSNTLRAGYPESKRCGEALCQAYIKQKGLDCVIPRLTRSYGPSMLKSDTKAISQFLLKALNNEDIVLKSEGKQYYSYTYVSDAVLGLLTVILKGNCGEAYNIADERSDITLKDLAIMIANTVGKKVIFDLPSSIESAGYSKATKARLDGEKLKSLGWIMHYDIHEGIERTLKILRESD